MKQSSRSVVIRDNYEVLTKQVLLDKVPNIVQFGSDAEEVSPILSDIFNILCIMDEHTVRDEEFLLYKYLNPNVQNMVNINLLLHIPLDRLHGVDNYEKVALLAYNVRLFTAKIEYSDDVFSKLEFNGHSDRVLFEKDFERVSELLSVNKYKQFVIANLISNIRTRLANLVFTGGMALSAYDLELSDINHINFPFLSVLSTYKEMIDANTSGVLAVKTVKSKQGTNKQSFRSTFNDISKIRKHKLNDPNFKLDMVKGNIRHNEPIIHQKNKQVIILNIDNSGSMQCKKKLSRVVAIVSSVLDKVIEGTAEVHLNWYEAVIVKSLVIKTEEEAKDAFTFVKRNLPKGNGTDIGSSLQTIIDRAVEAQMNEPHVFIILDGDDRVDPDSVNFKGVKVSTFLLGQSNKGVEDLCNRTGGIVSIDPLYEDALLNK